MNTNFEMPTQILPYFIYFDASLHAILDSYININLFFIYLGMVLELKCNMQCENVQSWSLK